MPLTGSQKKAWSDYFAALEVGEIKRLNLESCPVCKSRGRSIIAEKDRFGDGVISALCKGCGLIYSVNPFDAQSTAIFYRDHYRGLYTKSTSNAHAVEQSFRKWLSLAAELQKLCDFIGLDKEKDIVVETGTGAGWFLAPFAEQGFKTIGFDYDEDLLELGRARNLDLYNLTNTQIENVVTKCSLFVLREVLEHSSDPFEMLAEANGYLKDGGYIYLTVPSFNEIFFGYSSGQLLGALQNAHNFLFDRPVLLSLLEQAGFEPVIARCDLRVVARKARPPVRRPVPIPGNYRRNLLVLIVCEKVLQLYWRGLAKCLRFLGNEKEKYAKVRQWHRYLFSPTRRREIRQQRYVTGI